MSTDLRAEQAEPAGIRKGDTLKVFVLNMRGKPLMPCSPAKARHMLKAGKAFVVRRTPFTIKLTIATGETKQDVTLGVDAGARHVGISATTEKEEVFASEVALRQDITGLLADRLAFRRARSDVQGAIERRATALRASTIAFDQSTRDGLRRPWRTVSKRTFRASRRSADCFPSPRS